MKKSAIDKVKINGQQTEQLEGKSDMMRRMRRKKVLSCEKKALSWEKKVDNEKEESKMFKKKEKKVTMSTN